MNNETNAYAFKWQSLFTLFLFFVPGISVQTKKKNHCQFDGWMLFFFFAYLVFFNLLTFFSSSSFDNKITRYFFCFCCFFLLHLIEFPWTSTSTSTTTTKLRWIFLTQKVQCNFQLCDVYQLQMLMHFFLFIGLFYFLIYLFKKNEKRQN